jgi:copper homeostasis protein
MDVKKLEVACFSTLSAFEAEQSGADRIEFCKDYILGGITPDFHDIKLLKEKLQIPIYVMIRPRGGDFVYSEAEFNQMKNEITQLKKLHVDGFVFGILDEKNQINITQNKELVELAYPTPCTFHRAFDFCENPIEALENVIECGFQFILTSGNVGKATEGIGVLKQLVEKAQGRISIILGGGVRSSNIEFLNQKTDASWFHSACITDNSFEVNPSEIKDIKHHL